VLSWRKVVALACAAGVSACGGGGKAGQPAADCFNPQLFAVGTTARLDYQITGVFAGSGVSYTGTRTQAVSVQPSPGAAGPEVSVITDTTTSTNPPAPGQTNIARTRELQALDGLEIITRKLFQSYSFTGFDNEMETAYQPPVRDKRYTLRPGESFTLARNDVTATVIYAGQESISVPAGTYTACRFDERAAGGSVRTTWVIEGKGVVARSVQAGETSELLASSRLGGQPL
jgi:hypothetical protein